MYHARASEFPNDNPLLHHGAVWVCTLPCGPLQVLRVERHHDEADEAVAEVELIADVETIAAAPDEAPRNPVEQPEPADAFSALVEALAAVASAQGAADAARALRSLLRDGRVDGEALETATRDALHAGGLVVAEDEVLVASERVTTLTRAWREVLCGDGDLEACGSSTLNEWAADLLAVALGTPNRAQALQYELRRHGVAAFGVLRQAA